MPEERHGMDPSAGGAAGLPCPIDEGGPYRYPADSVHAEI